MTSKRLILDFPTEAGRDLFLAWLCDGGGEEQFMENTNTIVASFDYSYALPGWGYDSAEHGDPIVVLRTGSDDD